MLNKCWRYEHLLGRQTHCTKMWCVLYLCKMVEERRGGRNLFCYGEVMEGSRGEVMAEGQTSLHCRKDKGGWHSGRGQSCARVGEPGVFGKRCRLSVAGAEVAWKETGNESGRQVRAWLWRPSSTIWRAESLSEVRWASCIVFNPTALQTCWKQCVYPCGWALSDLVLSIVLKAEAALGAPNAGETNGSRELFYSRVSKYGIGSRV